jgi:uncharacterized membrane protein YphA (DoxX/SURF4 family)
LQKHYSSFPGGVPGIGLLILRASKGVATALYGGIVIACFERITTDQFSYFSNLILGLLLIAGSIFLILGLLMPFVLTVLAASELGAVAVRLMIAEQMPNDKFGWILLFLFVSITIALFFVGPGAYSIDARLYGRRRIFIPSPKKPESEEA